MTEFQNTIDLYGNPATSADRTFSRIVFPLSFSLDFG